MLATVLLTSNLIGQNCDCLKSMQFLEKEYENNLASYQQEVIEYKQQKQYQQYKNLINQTAKKITTTKDCIGLVARYQSFFRDEHLFISYNDGFYKFKSNKDTALIKQTFITDTRLYNQKTKSGITNKALEGVWYFQDGSFAVNIINNKSFNRQWAAIMVADNFPFWFKGQIKMEFIENADKTLGCIYWRGSRSPKYMKAIVKDSVLLIGKQYLFYRTKEQALNQKSTLSNDLGFKQLSPHTNYLRIPDFDISIYKKIDSIVLTNLKSIQSSSNLIIDLRNNGGGGDRSYLALLPLIFDTTIIPSPMTASVFVSKGNFNYYNNTKFENAQTKQDSLEEQQYVDKLKPYLGKFEPYKFSKDTLNFVYHYPTKVALITNRWCASSTEGFTLLAKESNKIIQFGEATGGIVSYGDWREIKIPGLPIWVGCTTKKMIFFNGAAIESIGIKPDVQLNPDNENSWIEEVQQYLEKKN